MFIKEKTQKFWKKRSTFDVIPGKWLFMAMNFEFFYFLWGKKSTKDDFYPKSCKKSPFYTRNRTFRVTFLFSWASLVQKPSWNDFKLANAGLRFFSKLWSQHNKIYKFWFIKIWDALICTEITHSKISTACASENDRSKNHFISLQPFIIFIWFLHGM